MPAKTFSILITVLAALTVVGPQAAAQPATDLVLHFAHTDSDKSQQEIGTLIRTISDKDITVNLAPGTLTVHGTADQLGLAQWLFVGLDRSTPVPADSAMHQFTLPDGSENVVRLFYLDRGQTVQQFQELATMVRTVIEIRRVFTYNDAKAIAFRGTADQMAMTDWMIGDIEKAAAGPRPHSVSRQYLLPSDPSDRRNENVTQIFYLANTPTVQDFQEVATLMRTIAEIRRVFTYNTPRAIAVRGTADQLAFANWLFNELDQPTHGAQGHASALYNFPDPSREGAGATRVFYLQHMATPQEFQQIATAIRTSAQIRRVFTWNEARGLALRGTLDQIELAEQLLKDLDPADFPKGQ